MKGVSRGKRREPERFFNRELSWLEFNGRVLEEAGDKDNPLLERLKFCTIVASNLDEFFMVRVASLKHRVAEGDLGADIDGRTPQQQLAEVATRVHPMVERLYRILADEILPSLAEREVRIVTLSGLDDAQRATLARYFQNEVLPALTPLAIDAARPSPLLSGLSINLALLISPDAQEEEPRLAVVQVPARLPRLVRLPGVSGACFVLLEEVIRAELPALFPGQDVRTSAVFRITRDAEMELDDEGGRERIDVVEDELRKRRHNKVVRLAVESLVSPELIRILMPRLGVDEEDVYRLTGMPDVRALQTFTELPLLDDLRDAPLRQTLSLNEADMRDIFSLLEARDVLLVHPYESFEPVTAFVSQAAHDVDVLAIKMTLYRTSGDSPIIAALIRAAESGKQVTVIVELMARFDEQSNIQWARRLEEAGAHVIYGVRGYKTHSKICLVVRRDARGIARYVHLGTGNYNDRTARLYTDCGLLTADRQIGEDASAFFNALTGYSDPPRMKKLVMAPTGMREQLLRLIARERRRAEGGQAAEIRAKLNSLNDEEIIRALYAASQAGVRIRLNIRGICCLRPGLKGLSDDITVVSIVDRFLEHARIVFFHNGGDEEVYLSSADWMPRNLDRRIELLFPVEDAECRRRLLTVLDAAFDDNVKARVLQPDGGYKRRRVSGGEEPVRSQMLLHRLLRESAERQRSASPAAFEPVRAAPRSGA